MQKFGGRPVRPASLILAGFSFFVSMGASTMLAGTTSMRMIAEKRQPLFRIML
jgi:hypothetical protein